MVYNNTTKTIVEAVELSDEAGIPQHIFDWVNRSGECDAYYHYVNVEGAVCWGRWSIHDAQWKRPSFIPDVVKMIGVLSG